MSKSCKLVLLGFLEVSFTDMLNSPNYLDIMEIRWE